MKSNWFDETLIAQVKAALDCLNIPAAYELMEKLHEQYEQLLHSLSLAQKHKELDEKFEHWDSTCRQKVKEFSGDLVLRGLIEQLRGAGLELGIGLDCAAQALALAELGYHAIAQTKVQEMHELLVSADSEICKFDSMLRNQQLPVDSPLLVFLNEQRTNLLALDEQGHWLIEELWAWRLSKVIDDPSSDPE